MSRKLAPSIAPASLASSDRWASVTRSSSTSARNRHQFSPNSNRSALTGTLTPVATVRWLATSAA
jgi:hypothetical protein